jgi:RNA polymerase sigma-70 factor (family 1)
VPDHTPYNERDLLRQVSEGSENAFRMIFTQYGPKLKSYVLKLSRSKETAEDIVHDVFLNIWKNRERLVDIENFDSYLFTAVRNTAHRSFKRRARETLMVAELRKADQGEAAFEGEDRITSREVQAFITEAIAKLSPQQKKIFLLSRDEGLSHDEIAQRLGIARRTVTNTITGALRSLRDDIGTTYGPYAVAIFVLHGLS